MPDIRKSKEKNSLLNELTDQQLLFLNNYLYLKDYQENEVILEQGSQGGDLYLITEGKVLVQVKMPGDAVRIATTLETGEIFGEVAFLADAPITASTIAKNKVKCIVFKKDVFNMLRIADPESAYKVSKAIVARTTDKITSNLKKIRDLLLSLPQDRIRSDESHFHPNHNATRIEVKTDELDQHFLNNMTCFRELSTSEIQEIIKHMKAYSFMKGYHFIPQSKKNNTINLICFGAVMLFIRKGDELIKSIAVSGTGELFMEHFLDPDIANYVTCEKCTILELSMENFIKLHQSNPAIFYKFSNYLHRTIIASLYIVNRQFVRIYTEYHDLFT